MNIGDKIRHVFVALRGTEKKGQKGKQNGSYMNIPEDIGRENIAGQKAADDISWRRRKFVRRLEQ
jgi:hypothetical protein